MVPTGLLREDLIMDELPGVKEALSRLPQNVIDERYFRIKRVGAAASSGPGCHRYQTRFLLTRKAWFAEHAT